jgi:hypothetical protein
LPLHVDLPPCGGAIIALYPEALGALSAKVAPGAGRGKDAVVELRLNDTKGKPFRGAVPVHVEITLPGGSPSAFSRYCLMENGFLVLNIPIAINDPPGRYSVNVHELATGQQASAEVIIRA